MSAASGMSAGAAPSAAAAAPNTATPVLGVGGGQQPPADTSSLHALVAAAIQQQQQHQLGLQAVLLQGQCPGQQGAGASGLRGIQGQQGQGGSSSMCHATVDDMNMLQQNLEMTAVGHAAGGNGNPQGLVWPGLAECTMSQGMPENPAAPASQACWGEGLGATQQGPGGGDGGLSQQQLLAQQLQYAAATADGLKELVGMGLLEAGRVPAASGNSVAMLLGRRVVGQ